MAVSAATAGIAAELEFIGLLQARGLTDSLDLGIAFAEGVYDETTVGPNGGEVRLQGQIHADGTGWYANEFSNFRDGDVTINGIEVTHVLRTTTGGTSEEARFEWIHFRVSSPDFSQSLNGSVTVYQDPFTLKSDRRLDVILTDLPSGASLRLENVLLVRDRTESFDQTYAFTGRVYDSGLGYLDASTETPLIFPLSAPTNPVSGGPWIAAGSNGAAIRLEPLSHLYASLQLVAASPTAPDRALRVSWDTPFFLQVGLAGDDAPVAISEPDGYVFEGERQVLDGRMSNHPGGQLHRYRWKLLVTPPGSQAAIEDSEAFRTGFTPDLPGSYLVILEVDDGIHTARDFTSFRLDPNEDRSDEASDRLYLPPDLEADVGDRITLDGTMIRPLGDRFRTEFDYTWFVTRYGASEGVPIEDGDGASPSFVVDEPGLYIVAAEVNQFAPSSPRDRQFIAAGRTLPPIATIAPMPTGGQRSDIAVSDVTGDGTGDIVVAHEGNSDTGSIPRVYVYPGRGSGHFGAPSALLGGTGGGVSVIDIGNDAKMDVAALTDHGVELFRQSERGVLQSIGVISENPACAANMPPTQTVPLYRSLGVGDMNADGFQDLVVQDACRTGLDVFFQRVDGSFNAPVSSQPNPFGHFSMLTIADMTDDGLDDVLIASLWSHSGDNARLLVAPGRGDGQIQPDVVEVVEADPAGNPRIATGDIDRDGHTDLVMAMRTSLLVYLQGDTGDLVLDQQVGSAPFLRAVALADIDADGRLDILASDTQDIDVHRQLEDGSFAAGEGLLTTLGARIGPQPDNPDPYVIFDVNGDGFDEIVYANKGYVITLFPRQPLICGGLCDVADNEGAQKTAASADREYALLERGMPLALSRQRIMRESSWGAH